MTLPQRLRDEFASALPPPKPLITPALFSHRPAGGLLKKAAAKALGVPALPVRLAGAALSVARSVGRAITR